jgi:hypothetical protein
MQPAVAEAAPTFCRQLAQPVTKVDIVRKFVLLGTEVDVSGAR